MPLTRIQKEERIQEIQQKAEKAKLTIFVNFRGLKATDVSTLRKSLRNAGIDFKVTKKTLLKRVLNGLGIQGDAPTLEGELATAFGYEESPEAAKILKDFSKTHEGVKILGGISGGQYVVINFIDALAAIPSREVLLGQFAGVLCSPVTGFVGVLGGPLRDMIRVTYQLSKK